MNSKKIRLGVALSLAFVCLSWYGCATPPVKEEPAPIEATTETPPPVVEAPVAVETPPPVVEAPAVAETPPVVEAKAPEKIEAPANIHTASDGRIFVKSKAPIYLNIATIYTEDDGNDVPLRNEATKKAQTKPKPFYFEGHGKHSLVHPPNNRRLAYKRKGANLFYVFVDGKAPVINLSTPPVPKVERKGKVILGRPADITLSYQDKDAGLYGRYVSLDGEPFRTYDGPVSLQTEGDYLLKYFAYDNVGNRTRDHRQKFAVDLTPPESSYEIVHIIRTDSNEIVLSPKSIITLSSRDKRAGVKSIHYALGGPIKEYNGRALSTTHLNGGPQTLVYFAEDRVQNREERKELPFYLDNRPPTASFEVSGDQHRSGSTLYVSGRSKGEITAVDDKAGVGEIRFYTDSKKGKIYTEPFSFPKKNGKFTFGYSAADRVDNVSGKTWNSVVVDIWAPKVTPSFRGPHYYTRGTHYIRNHTHVMLSAKDNLSGLKSLSYDLDGIENITYTDGFSLTSEGEHTLLFHAVDNVNNTGKNRKITLYVDEKPPEIYPHFSIDSTAAKEGVYPKKSRLYLGATDEQSGVETILYRINNGKELVYKSPLEFTARGRYTIIIRAIDRVGNASEKEVSFRVK